MKEVHDLFGGWGSVEAVLKAAALRDPDNLSEHDRNHLCYAHLYLALYFEAMGDMENMKAGLRWTGSDLTHNSNTPAHSTSSA